MAKPAPQITKYQLVQIDSLQPLMDDTEVGGQPSNVPKRYDTREAAQEAYDGFSKKEQKNLTISEVKVDA